MTISMGIRHRETGVYDVVPVSTNRTFRDVWLPACQQLGLEWVSWFDGGAFTRVPEELIPPIIAELERLREWAAEKPHGEYLIERCTDILGAFVRTSPATHDYDFG